MRHGHCPVLDLTNKACGHVDVIDWTVMDWEPRSLTQAQQQEDEQMKRKRRSRRINKNGHTISV